MLTISQAKTIVNTIMKREWVKSKVVVSFSNRMTRAKGRASVTNGKYKIALSRKLFAADTEKNNINTVIHEACHIVCFEKFQWAKPHGKKWAMLMVKHGGSPKRCHSLKVKVKKQNKVVAYCGCGEHLITKNRYTRMTNGAIYRCRVCKLYLTFSDLAPTIARALQ